MEAPLALYRRYRPETFSEVIGQDHVTAPLRNALSNNRVNHAYLFSGPRGCGKTTSARILARAINCEKGPIAEPCGVCKSCTDLARGGPGSIDVIEIDAASHGGVDDARDLRERAFFAPVESRYKIYIIDEAHMVTTQGFNALLKLVEEPPPHLKFIFATTEPDKVIGTIRSRTHHYPFRLVPPKALGDYMASLCESEGVAIEPAALPLVVRAGAGSVRDSLSVLDQLIGGAGPDGVTYELAVALLGFTPDSLLDACVDGFAAHDSKAVFETIEKVIETGQDPKRFAEDLLRRLRDLVVLSAVPNAIHSGLIEAAEDQGERLQTQAAGIGAAELTRAADIVAAGLLEMRGATAPRLQLELICAKVLLPGADDSTNGIQARLDRLERRLTIPAGTPEAVQPPAAVGGPEPDAATSRAAARAAAGGSPTGTAAAGGSAAGTAPAGAVGGPSVSGPVSGPAVGGSAGTSPSSGDSAGPGGPANAGRAGRSAGDGVGSGSPSGGAHPGSSRSGAWGDESASATPAPSSQPPSSQPAESAPAASAAPGSASGRSATPGSAPASSAGPGTVPGISAAAASSGGGPGSTATGASGAPSAGAVGLADIRRLWPEVLEAVKAKRRFAWIMLSQNAQVIAVDDQTLTLGLVNAGARESFARSGSDEILRQAMIDTIGLNRRIEAVVDPSTDPGAGGGGHRPPAPPTSPSTPASGTPAPGNAPAPGGTPGPGGASAPDDAAGPGGAGPGGAAGPGGGGAGGGGAGGGAGTGVGTGATGGPSSTGATASGGAVGVVGNPAGAGPGTPGGAGGSAGATGAANSQSDATDAAGGPAGTATRGSGGADSPGADAADGPGGYATDAAGRGGPHASGSAAGHAGHAGSSGIGGSGAGGATGAESTAGGPGIGGPSADASAAGGVGVGDSRAGGPAAGGVTGGGSGGSGAGSSPGGASAGGGPGAVGAMAGGSGGAGAGGPGASGHVVGRGGVAVEEPPDYDVPPEPDPWDDPPPPPSRRPSDAVGSQVGGNRREQAASKRRAAEAAVAAEQARRAAQGSAAPEVALTPEEEADAIGEDDLVLEDDSQSHTELLRQTLGAQIITEEPN